MKMANKYLVLVLGGSLIASCADLDTIPEGGTFTNEQKQQVVEMMPERLQADVTGMFSQISASYKVIFTSARDDDFGYPAVCLSQDLNGPDMVSTNSDYNWFSTCSEFSDRSDTYANPYLRWALFYNQIKQANDILKSIPADTDNTTLLRYKAQAKAVRAFDYLCIVPYFQFKYKGNEDKPTVPLVTHDMEGDPSSNPRATAEAAYKLIMDDMNEAIDIFKDLNYTRSSKNEVDLNVAYGLRARANLYMENWAEAASDAQEAMKGYAPYTREDVSKPTFIDHKAANWIWGSIIAESNIQRQLTTWPAAYSSFAGRGYATGQGCYKMINNLLFRKIPHTDVRKGWWVDENLHSDNLADLTWGDAIGDEIASLSIPDVKVPFAPYTNVKFAQYGGVGNDKNAGDWCMMRYEEMLLIAAEGTAMAGDLPGGKAILENFIKAYRDENYVCTSADATSFQNEVWFQRRVELWGEGFSMADIMRLGKNIVRVSSAVTTNFPGNFAFNIASNDGWLLMRIPQDETNSNAGIPLSANNNGGRQPQPGDGAGLKDGVTD